MDNKDKYKLMVLLQNSSNDKKSVTFCPGLDPSNSPPLQEMASSSFCTISNLKNSIVYLAQELQNLGFRYKIVEANEEKLNLVALVNACWDIIQLYHSAIKDSNIMHDSRRRDIADINHLQGSVRDLKSMVEEKDRLLLEIQEKERQVNSINKALASKLKAEKDDVKRLNGVLQQRDIQHQHEIRKKEIEMNKMQDRLQRLITNERGAEARIPTITMTSSLSRSDRARGRWRTDNTSVKQEEELYRRVLGQFETWVGQLTEESDLLKEFLGTFSGKLSKLALKCANSQLSSSVVHEEDGLNDSLACSVLSSDNLEEDTVFSLNFLTSKDKIQKLFNENLQVISQSLENKEFQCRNEPHDSDLVSSMEKNMVDVVEGLCIEKETELDEQMKQILELKKKLQRERDVFSAATVRLNRERANFEIEKVELLRNQFLEELPPSLLSNSGTPFTPNTSLESPVSGSLSDLYGDSPHSIPAIPALTSPTGNITQTTHPVTLGPTRLPRSHRDNKLRTSRGGGGRSDPTTRQSSLNRTTDMRYLHEVPRSKTLERSTRSTCPTPCATDADEGISYSTRSLSRPVKRKQQQPKQHLDILANVNLSHSINCPPLEIRDRFGVSSSEHRSVVSPSGERVVSRAPLSHTTSLTAEENISYDSGFCYDHEDPESPSYSSQQVRNLQTNSRLNALESSLMNLLDQINAKERFLQTCPPGGLTFSHESIDAQEEEAVKEEASSQATRKRSFAILPNKPFRSLSSESGASTSTLTRHSIHSPQLPSASANTLTRHSSHPTHQPDIENMLASRQYSMPGSSPSSRKSSSERKTGEYYLKKIQNNFSKWYWK